ncbi:MAG: hypothetical protein CMJ18_10060 [Phycisphaeraceae bacterium]|nr:hypothetical protein [Phycisphaeraceae bacterium]
MPYRIGSDFEFVPNERFRPLRVSVINNCLAPGLWEISANDRSGEIYHGWFELPDDDYFGMTARVNRLPIAFVRGALDYRKEVSVSVDLDRLRDADPRVETVSVSLAEGRDAGFSTQDSRRKLRKGYVLVEGPDGLAPPSRIDELTLNPVHLAEFIPPGKYSLSSRRRFDLGLLRPVSTADVRRVTPKTFWHSGAAAGDDGEYVEITIDLDTHRIVVGNLPVDLLVPQEDFAIFGFGVGIFNSGDFAERRRLLVDLGPAPSYAYIMKRDGDGWVAVNSHECGVDQIFIRTYSQDADPHWDVTITSYERMVDLVRYRIGIPTSLRAALAERADAYISPVYRTYRDDNIK